MRAKKDAREPSLMKAIVKCYWKFYFALGLLMFLEVKVFTYCALTSKCMQISTEMDEMVGREESGLRSEEKTCL